MPNANTCINTSYRASVLCTRGIVYMTSKVPLVYIVVKTYLG